MWLIKKMKLSMLVFSKEVLYETKNLFSRNKVVNMKFLNSNKKHFLPESSWLSESGFERRTMRKTTTTTFFKHKKRLGNVVKTFHKIEKVLNTIEN